MRVLALLVGLLAASCSQAPAEVEARQHPTIVSLNPCSDAILAEVADREQILAISHFSQDPSSSSMELDDARSYPAVSGSAEEVLALSPDLIVADEFVPAATRAAFADLGLRLVQLPIVSSVEQAKQQVLNLARLAGHPERGRALNARIDAALAQARPPLGDPVAAIVWQSGGIVPGRKTLVADMLERTGFAHLSATRGMRQADVLPLEAMLADPPQVIFSAGDPRSNEDRMLSHPALEALDQTSRERFDRSLLWCGGPTIIRAAERLNAVRNSL
ncbi:MAG: ABC transporter substrate-binding protein [Novosphingobium sp.]|nr:ABC transporter substrate-binding protein [Novosphingobium sp.]MCP5402340.1 ABC transporter substrate-binding protein [Novosphingobium sp.]